MAPPCTVVPVETEKVNWRVLWRAVEDASDPCAKGKQHLNTILPHLYFVGTETKMTCGCDCPCH